MQHLYTLAAQLQLIKPESQGQYLASWPAQKGSQGSSSMAYYSQGGYLRWGWRVYTLGCSAVTVRSFQTKHQATHRRPMLNLIWCFPLQGCLCSTDNHEWFTGRMTACYLG